MTRGEMHGGSDLLEEEQVGTASFLAVRQVKGGNDGGGQRPTFSLQRRTTEDLGGP